MSKRKSWRQDAHERLTRMTELSPENIGVGGGISTEPVTWWLNRFRNEGASIAQPTVKQIVSE